MFKKTYFAFLLAALNLIGTDSSASTLPHLITSFNETGRSCEDLSKEDSAPKRSSLSIGEVQFKLETIPTRSHWHDHQSRLLKSSDQGKTWKVTYTDEGTGVYTEKAWLAKDDFENLYIIGQHRNARRPNSPVIHISSDKGLSWKSYDPGHYGSMTDFMFYGDTLFILGSKPFGGSPRKGGLKLWTLQLSHLKNPPKGLSEKIIPIRVYKTVEAKKLGHYSLYSSRFLKAKWNNQSVIPRIEARESSIGDDPLKATLCSKETKESKYSEYIIGISTNYWTQTGSFEYGNFF